MSQNEGAIRITRATQIEGTPPPATLSMKSAGPALVRQEAGTRPGTRGPHANLFQGGLFARKAAPEPELSVAQRSAAYLATQKLSTVEQAVLGVVAAHVLTYDTPLTDDGFAIARTAGVDYETAFEPARDRLLAAGIFRIQSVGSMGIDGLTLDFRGRLRTRSPSSASRHALQGVRPSLRWPPRASCLGHVRHMPLISMRGGCRPAPRRSMRGSSLGSKASISSEELSRSRQPSPT